MSNLVYKNLLTQQRGIGNLTGTAPFTVTDNGTTVTIAASTPINVSGIVNTLYYSTIAVGTVLAVSPVYNGTYVSAQQVKTFTVTPYQNNTNSTIYIIVNTLNGMYGNIGTTLQTGSSVALYNSTSSPSIKAGFIEIPTSSSGSGATVPFSKTLSYYYSYTQTTGTTQTFYLCFADMYNFWTSRFYGSGSGSGANSTVTIIEQLN